MRVQDFQFLSIWEIAHRWEGCDPDELGRVTIMSKLGVRLRQLIWTASHAIHCYDVHGEQLPMEYLWFGFPKTSLAKKLDIAFHDPGAHRDFLRTVFINQNELKKVLLGCNDLPEFWFEDWELANVHRPSRLASKHDPDALPRRPDQQDRLTCQQIARRLWSENPTMTIADMTRNPEILVQGNGKAYKGKNTLRNWLKEVAPPAVRNRRGRPKKGGS